MVEINEKTKKWFTAIRPPSAHSGEPNKIAYCAVGQRRFTLLSVDQIANLYPVLLEST